MPRNPDAKLLDNLEDCLDEDVLSDEYPDSEIAAELEEYGGNPDAIALRGAELAGELQAKSRLRWQETARAERNRLDGIVTASLQLEPSLEDMSRDALIAELSQLRDSPELPIAAAFRKRRPEESSEADLRELLKQARTLQRLVAAKRDAGEE